MPTRVLGQDASSNKLSVFWNRELTGFGVRVHPSGSKVHVVQVQGRSGPKRVTVGRHGTLTAEQARQLAALIIARGKAGAPSAPEAAAGHPNDRPTVGALVARYLKEHGAVRCKP